MRERETDSGPGRAGVKPSGSESGQQPALHVGRQPANGSEDFLPAPAVRDQDRRRIQTAGRCHQLYGCAWYAGAGLLLTTVMCCGGAGGLMAAVVAAACVIR